MISHRADSRHAFIDGNEIVRTVSHVFGDFRRRYRPVAVSLHETVCIFHYVERIAFHAVIFLADKFIVKNQVEQLEHQRLAPDYAERIFICAFDDYFLYQIIDRIGIFKRKFRRNVQKRIFPQNVFAHKSVRLRHFNGDFQAFAEFVIIKVKMYMRLAHPFGADAFDAVDLPRHKKEQFPRRSYKPFSFRQDLYRTFLDI